MTHKAKGAAAQASHGVGHVVPLWLLIAVLLALLVLTYVTVAATYFDLGAANLWLAMAIATLKAYLVALYFMHLRYDRPFNGVLFMCALAFVALFVGIALMDSLAYRPDLIPGYAPGMAAKP